MTIDKIAGTNAVTNVPGSHAARDTAASKAGADSVSVSKEGRYMSALYFADKVAAETPDVRADKVARARELLADPNWPDAAVMSDTADKIRLAFGI